MARDLFSIGVFQKLCHRLLRLLQRRYLVRYQNPLACALFINFLLICFTCIPGLRVGFSFPGPVVSQTGENRKASRSDGISGVARQLHIVTHNCTRHPAARGDRSYFVFAILQIRFVMGLGRVWLI